MRGSGEAGAEAEQQGDLLERRAKVPDTRVENGLPRVTLGGEDLGGAPSRGKEGQADRSPTASTDTPASAGSIAAHRPARRFPPREPSGGPPFRSGHPSFLSDSPTRTGDARTCDTVVPAQDTRSRARAVRRPVVTAFRSPRSGRARPPTVGDEKPDDVCHISLPSPVIFCRAAFERPSPRVVTAPGTGRASGRHTAGRPTTAAGHPVGPSGDSPACLI